MSTASTASERAIEDILVQAPSLLIEILDFVTDRPKLVERQQSLPTGRADLVYLVGGEVLIIELKVVPATIQHVEQIQGYVDAYQEGTDGTEFAEDRQFITVLLAPDVPSDIYSDCESQGIKTTEYDPDNVYGAFQESLFADLVQFQVTGLVTSVARLALCHGYLRYLYTHDDPVTVSEAAKHYDTIGKGHSTSPEDRINKFRKTTYKLSLVTETTEGTILTDRGKQYIEAEKTETVP